MSPSEFHTNGIKRTLAEKLLEGLLFNKTVTIDVSFFSNLVFADALFLCLISGKGPHFLWWMSGNPSNGSYSVCHALSPINASNP